MLPIAILAGGLATRLRPLTQTIPKSLIEVGGRPFIYWQLEALKSQGADRVVLCLGHMGDLVQDAVGDGAQFGLDIAYSFDGKELRGTGGAIAQALPLLGDAFFVLYGDSFLPIAFAPVKQAFLSAELPGLMTVMRNNNRWDTSNAVFQDGLVVEYSKVDRHAGMEFIDYGLGVLEAGVFEHYRRKNVFDLAEIYHRLAAERNLAGYQVRERFYEIGSFEGLKQTEDFLLGRCKE